MDSSHGTRPRRSQSVRRRTIDDTLSGLSYFYFLSSEICDRSWESFWRRDGQQGGISLCREQREFLQISIIGNRSARSDDLAKRCFLLDLERDPGIYRIASFDQIQFQERHRHHTQSCSKHHRSLQRHPSHTRYSLSASQSCDQSNGRQVFHNLTFNLALETRSTLKLVSKMQKVQNNCCTTVPLKV